MGKELEQVKKVLKEYGQEHLLLKYDEMDEHDQRTLLDQIEDIDFDLMKELYEQATKPVDPLLIGMSIHNKVLAAAKAIEKTDPKEKVGVLCRKNKKVGVVDYT